jgi:hypothetical protein
MYKKAIRKGYKPEIKAKSPPGWSGTVERLKDHVDDESSAFKLAWWMYNQGYTPHYPETGDEDKKK